LKLSVLLKNVKKWVYDSSNAVADNEIKMYENWFPKEKNKNESN
jgi:hypothetical protein